MQPISRRRALLLGGLTLAATIVGTIGLTRGIGSGFAPVVGAGLAEPPALRSTGGGLQVRLETAESQVPLAGGEATALGYNGRLPGPILHLQPGDRLQIELVNRLTEPTNLYVHGLYVSPEGNGDNVFVFVEPGSCFQLRLPATGRPPTGRLLHGLVADQVFGGLYGAIIVGDPEPVPVTRERVLVVSDIFLDAGGHLQQPSIMGADDGPRGQPRAGQRASPRYLVDQAR